MQERAGPARTARAAAARAAYQARVPAAAAAAAHLDEGPVLSSRLCAAGQQAPRLFALPLRHGLLPPCPPVVAALRVAHCAALCTRPLEARWVLPSAR